MDKSDPSTSGPEPGARGGSTERPPVFNAPRSVLGLCGLLLAIHAVLWVLGDSARFWAMERFAFVPLYVQSLMDPETVSAPPAVLFTILTHAFLHGDWLHVLINSGFLLAFGSMVARVFGPWRFFVAFAITAAAGAITQMLAAPPSLTFMIGASGAVYGMVGMVVVIMAAAGTSEGRRRAYTLALVLMAINLLLGIFGIGDALAGAAVAWQAHIGGFVAGLVLGGLWFLRLKRRFRFSGRW